MDIATLIGLVVGTASFAYGIMGTKGLENLKLFWALDAAVLVFGGTFAAILIAFPMEQVINTGKVLLRTFMTKSADPYKLVGTLVSMAEKARREGLLALEEDAAQIEDPYFRSALQMVVDGTEPDVVRSIMEIELAFLEERHLTGKKICDQFGALAPAMGMIGTIIGLVIMLANFNDPAEIGPGMSLALVTTFFGAILANFLFIPMASKLECRTREESLSKQLIVEGILAIQHGENPKIVEQRLLSFLAPAIRKRFEAPQATAAEA